MVSYIPGADVLVDLGGDDEWYPGEVLKVERSGFVLCKIHVDPLADFGRASPCVMPEQVVAVRSGHVRLA